MVYETARQAGWLRRRRRADPRADRQRARLRRQDPADPQRRPGSADGAAGRGGGARLRGGRRRPGPTCDEETRAAIAREVGIGAVKYADLSIAHDTEYVFDFDRMLALNGNTGPYLQYAVARGSARSSARAASTAAQVSRSDPGHRACRACSRARSCWTSGPAWSRSATRCEPHRLCTYLFDLAQTFTAFYEHCPVLKADRDEVRNSRLALTAVTLHTLVKGLDLLGVRAPEQM